MPCMNNSANDLARLSDAVEIEVHGLWVIAVERKQQSQESERKKSKLLNKPKKETRSNSKIVCSLFIRLFYPSRRASRFLFHSLSLSLFITMNEIKFLLAPPPNRR